MILNLLYDGFFSLRRAVHFVLEVLIFFSVFLVSCVRPLLWTMRLMGKSEEAEALAHRLMGRWCRWVFRALGCRVVVEGRENLPLGTAYVVMSNHQSNYDPILLAGFLDPALSFITKRELFRVPGLAFFLRHNRSLKLDRRDLRGGAKALVAYGRELKARGGGVVIFPEGTRTKDPRREVQSFMGGSLMLVLDNGLPVVPVALDGTRLAGTRALLVRTPRNDRVIRLRILPPILAEKNTSAERRRLIAEIRRRVVSNWEAIRVEWTAGGTSPGMGGEAAGEEPEAPHPNRIRNSDAGQPGAG